MVNILGNNGDLRVLIIGNISAGLKCCDAFERIARLAQISGPGPLMPITAHYSQERNECITYTFAILPNYILLHALKRRRKLFKRIMSFDILSFPLDSCVVCCQDFTHFFSYERVISFAQTNRIIDTLYN